MSDLNTPVLLMIFNRPETTNRIFEAVRKTRPKQLFVAADGPRPGRADDEENCRLTRDIVTQIDWDCELQTLFRSENLGCGLGPAQNITWFFEHVEKGIILEDDCLPDPSFFSFCGEMLDFHERNLSVGQISGDNFQHGRKRGETSYYFSKYFHICGWATWRNRWEAYSFNIKNADAIINQKIIDLKCETVQERRFWYRKLDMLRGGQRKDIWDYQWMFANWYLNRISAVSNVNLISNIGFDTDATHTVQFNPKVANLPTEPINIIVNSDHIVENTLADHYTFFKSGTFSQPSFQDRIRWKAKKLIRSILKVLKKTRPVKHT